MIHNFKCPHCGAPLKYDSDRDSTAIKCEYCEMSTPVPEEFRPKAKGTSGVSYGPSPELMDQIQALLQRNNKIEAIKIMRTGSGLGLKEAKDFIDALGNDDTDAMNAILSKLTQPLGSGSSFSTVTINTPPHTSKATAPAKSNGCASVIVMIVIAAVVGSIVLSNTRGLLGLLNDPQIKAIGTAMPGVPKEIEKLQKVAEKVRGPFTGMNMREDAMLVNLDDKAQPDILTQAYEPGNSAEVLAYVDTLGNTVRWRVPNTLQSKFVVDEANVYMNNKTRLLAIDRKTGQTRWESTLSDEVSAGCDGCLQPAGKLLIALSNDDNLQAFELSSGKRLWERSLSAGVSHFWIWGDKVVVMDRHAGVMRVPMQITVLDSQGEVSQQFDVACKIPKTQRSVGGDETANPGDALYFDAASGMLYAWYGTFSSCVQKYDLNTGELQWGTGLDADPPNDREVSFVLNQGQLYMGGGTQVFAVDVNTGKARAVVKKVDGYDNLTVLGYQNGVLLLRVMKSRGTRHLELWAVQASADATGGSGEGKRLWQRVFDKEGGPMSQPNTSLGRTTGIFKEGDESDLWTWRLNASGLRLLHFTTAPKLQWVIETINLRDGVSAGQKMIEITSDGLLYSAPAILGWQGDTAWVQFHTGHYAIDTAQAKIVFATE